MRLAGIISEYNPFHNGHLYHIEQTRKSGATHIVCAMSGNFVQRGDCACADKYIRAKAAVLSGADLVVEIPTPWACSGAENFARGGVSILASLGIDVLSFGCETDELSLLEKTAAAVDSPLISQSVRTLVSAGNTYPAALQKSIEAVFGKVAADILSSPNNTLAVEYIRQREKLSAQFELLAVRRKSAGHNDEHLPENGIASASALRRLLQLEKMKNYIPQAMLTELAQAEKRGLFPCLLENADRVILAFLRRMTLEEMKKYISDENGLAERLYSFSRTAQSTAAVIKQVKVKSITEAAVRRAVLSCFLKIPKDAAKGFVPYIKILASNARGFEILRERNILLPVITKKAHADKLEKCAKAIYDLECECTDVFSLFSKKIPGCSREQTSPIFVL